MLSLLIESGRTENFTITATDNGAPLNLTGAVLTFSAKESADNTDAQALIRKDSAGLGGIAITNAALGLATLTLHPQDSAAIAAGRSVTLVCALSMAQAGSLYTLDSGTMTVLPSVTQ